MGSTDGASDETPVRDVRITCGFWLGAYPVLQREYRYIMGRNPSRKQALRCPVENVSWLDAERFCAELTDREYQALRLPAGYEYRLPTEAEWEYAARGGPAAGIDVFAGSTSVGKVAWYKENSGGRTHLAGTKQPNELGLHDMSGNVWEWCWDWYRADAYGDEHAVDPVCAKESGGRVIRGGSWLSPSGATRVATRNGCWPYTPDSDTGFRVCLGPRLDTVLARSTRELPCGGSETRPNRAP
jgi:formylglycine-generating enzyme required for sulfatase activity